MPVEEASLASSSFLYTYTDDVCLKGQLHGSWRKSDLSQMASTNSFCHYMSIKLHLRLCQSQRGEVSDFDSCRKLVFLGRLVTWELWTISQGLYQQTGISTQMMFNCLISMQRNSHLSANPNRLKYSNLQKNIHIFKKYFIVFIISRV